MLHVEACHVALDELWVAQRGAKHNDALLMRRRGVGSCPHWLAWGSQRLEPDGQVAPCVPDARFAEVDTDAAICLQGRAQHIEDGPSSIRLANRVDVVEKSEKVFTRLQPLADLL